MFHNKKTNHGNRNSLFNRYGYQSQQNCCDCNLCNHKSSCHCCDCHSFDCDCFYFYPKFPIPPNPPAPTVLRTETFQYTALSDGEKRIYTNEDALPEYASTVILNPNTVSYVNLFINGMLQPSNFYKVEEGRMTLLTSGALPENGVPVILQFVKILSG